MKEIRCKHCGGSNFVKNGKQKGRQNYWCKGCKRNFVIPRRNQNQEVEKRLAVILYGSSKASFRFLAKLFNVCPATVLNWVRTYGESIEEPVVPSDLQDIEIDEMWHYLYEKKENYGSLKPLIEEAEELLRGSLVAETLPPLEGFMKS